MRRPRTFRRRLLRASVVLFLILLVPVLSAGPASGHTRAQASNNFDSRIVSAPQLEGVEWRLYAGGDLIELTNDGPHDLVVLGYEGEPYLRIGPEGVFENRNSPATYLNTERYADVAIPPRADASAEPLWTRVADGPSRAWHDHRIHWMSPERPAQLATLEGPELHLRDWQVEFTYGGQTHELAGELRWIEPGPWWPWLLIGLALTAPIAAGVRRSNRRAPWVRAGAVGVAAVALVNSIHFVDELLAWPVPTLDVLFGILHTVLFVGTGLVGAAVAWRRQAPLVLMIASGAVLFHQGLLQLPILSSSQLPTIWPPTVLRLAVAASLAQAVWVVVLLAVTRRPAPADGAAPSAGMPSPAGPTEFPAPLQKESI